jgi:hypothetical protein
MSSDLRRIALIATVTALSVTALIAILALLTQDFGETQLRILATTGGFGLASLIAMRGTVLLEHGRQLTLGRAVIALSILSFVIEMWIIWLDTNSEAAWKSYVCSIAAAGALGQIAGMIARRRATDPPSIAPLVWAAGACAVVGAVMAWTAALEEIDDSGYYRVFGVVVVLDVLLLALQPVVRRLGSPTRPAPASPSETGFVCVLADGRRLRSGAGNDLPAAVAEALRNLERRGERVTRIEFGGG